MKSKIASKASDIVRWRPKPTLSVDSRDLKTVKEMQIGKTYTFTVTAKVVSLDGPDDSDYPDEYNSERGTRARLRITKISEK